MAQLHRELLFVFLFYSENTFSENAACIARPFLPGRTLTHGPVARLMADHD
jgi:hypothetical protein